jgi:hypothetical protein
VANFPVLVIPDTSSGWGAGFFPARPYDAVVRVYDDAGNVIANTSTRAISKSGDPRGMLFEKAREVGAR